MFVDMTATKQIYIYIYIYIYIDEVERDFVAWGLNPMLWLLINTCRDLEGVRECIKAEGVATG